MKFLDLAKVYIRSGSGVAGGQLSPREIHRIWRSGMAAMAAAGGSVLVEAGGRSEHADSTSATKQHFFC